MVELHIIQTIIDNLAIVDSYNSLHIFVDHISSNVHFLAQQVKDPKVLDQMQNAFNYFIKSGQVWALGIGFFFGYWIRGITA